MKNFPCRRTFLLLMGATLSTIFIAGCGNGESDNVVAVKTPPDAPPNSTASATASIPNPNMKRPGWPAPDAPNLKGTGSPSK